MIGGFIESFSNEWEVVGSSRLPPKCERPEHKTVHRDKTCVHLKDAEHVFKIVGECLLQKQI